jgi:hypothetical protein
MRKIFGYPSQMPFELPLNEMTLSEKLQLMEALWDSLARKPEEVESPAWHGEVLEECRRRAERGEEHFSDWEAAKADIRRRTS